MTVPTSSASSGNPIPRSSRRKSRLRRKARTRRKLRANLSEFLGSVADGQYRPQRKFLRDFLLGSIVSGSVVLARIAESLVKHEDVADEFYILKRLSRNICSDRFDFRAFQKRLLERASRRTLANDGEGVVVGFDYTDLSKPYSDPKNPRGMEGVCYCRDGSKKKIGPGYPVGIAGAVLPSGARFPILIRPYSFKGEDFASTSENRVWLRQVAEIVPHVGSRALWVFDRGFKGRDFYFGLDEQGTRWLVRQKINVSAVFFDERGEEVRLREIVNELDLPFKAKIGRGGQGRATKIEFGAKTVFLHGGGNKPYRRPEGPARTLVVVWGFGNDGVAYLFSERIDPHDRTAVYRLVRAYSKRWRTEEMIRAAKDEDRWGPGLENVRVLTTRGVVLIAALVSAIYLLLSEIDERRRLREDVASVACASGVVPKDLSYRLFRGAGVLLGDIGVRAYREFRAAA